LTNKLKKKISYFLLFTILFILANIASFFFILFYLKMNLFSTEYLEFKKRFSKAEYRLIYPHPFFGLSNSEDKNYEKLIESNEPVFYKLPKVINNDSIKILIVGGSLATHFSQNDSNDNFIINDLNITKDDIFEKSINNFYNTNRFKVFNASIPGGKQPQQLFKLNYLILNNFKFDLILNIDGFNEIALSIGENLKISNLITYPRQYSKTLNAFSKDIRCAKDSNLAIEQGSILPIKEIYNLGIIYFCHKKIYGDQNNDITDLGLLTNFNEESELSSAYKAEKIWKNSSNMIYKISKIYGFDYIHIIQPNQYYSKSKILSKNEIEVSNFEKYKNPIEKYYSFLQVQNLIAVNKYDSRYLFKSNKETLYRDYCCHLNNKGIYLLSNSILKEFDHIFSNLLVKK